MACAEHLKTQAWFDGELEGAEAAAAQAHVAGCAECAETVHTLERAREGLRDPSLYRGADAQLRRRIERALAAEVRPAARRASFLSRPFWLGALNGALATAAAAALVFFFALSPETDELVGDVTSAHLRSLAGTHLVDLKTDNPDLARTWLESHGSIGFDVRPPAEARLIGVRADYVYESNAGVAVYRVGNRVVNVFAWPEHEDEALPHSASSKGFTIVFWKRGNIVFCAVANLPTGELERFERV